MQCWITLPFVVYRYINIEFCFSPKCLLSWGTTWCIMYMYNFVLTSLHLQGPMSQTLHMYMFHTSDICHFHTGCLYTVLSKYPRVILHIMYLLKQRIIALWKFRKRVSHTFWQIDNRYFDWSCFHTYSNNGLIVVCIFKCIHRL